MLPKAFLTPLNPPWEDAEPVTLGFLRPKFSRTEPKVVVAEQPWSIYDPSTCSPERLVFDGKPVVTGAGLEVLEPQLEIHEGGRLDLAACQDLEAADLPTVNKRTGMKVRLEFTGEGKRARVTGVRFNSATLSLDTELETESGWTTVGELLRQSAGHTRCHAPFRESTSWAAYYSTHKDGTPFVWDTGTNTKFVLPDTRREIRVYGASLPSNVADAELALAEVTKQKPAQGVYQRGGVLARIARLPAATVSDGIRRAAGSLQILTAGPDFLRMRLTQAAVWLRFDKRSEEWVKVDAPAAVSRTLADIAGMWPNTRNLAGIIEAPSSPGRHDPREARLRPGFGPQFRPWRDRVSRYPREPAQA